MKEKDKKVSLVAYITIRGLESLNYGRLDLCDPRLDGMPGTVLLELHTDLESSKILRQEVQTAWAISGPQAALRYMDDIFIRPGHVMIALGTTGDPTIDEYIERKATECGFFVKTATANTQN